jgi:hypothetical protein
MRAVTGGLGLKFLSSKELWAKSWEQRACEGERAFRFDEIYICYPVYLIVKSRKLRGKSDRLCRIGKSAGKCWVRRISPFHFSKKLKVNRPPLRSVVPTRRTPRRVGQPLSWLRIRNKFNRSEWGQPPRNCRRRGEAVLRCNAKDDTVPGPEAAV